MYALLYNEYSATEGWFQFQYLELVRLENNDYATGRGSYFPTATVKHDEAFPRVDESVYSSGKRKTQQQAARKFLEAIGVREVGEVEEIKAILAARYQKDGDQPDDTTHVKDLRRFFAIVENNPETAEIFLDYHVFVNADKEWSKSTNCYLDEPFQTTGLSDFYFALGEDADKSGLWNGYSTNGISLKRMVKFAKLVGVQYELEVTEIECMENPERVHLWRVPGNRYTYSQIDRDFTVLNLNKALKKPTVEMSRLIWQFMNSLPSYPNYLRATFQKNEANGAHHAASQLVHILCNADWIPQEDGEFVKPIDADRDLLLEGFPYDSGDKWLEAVKFGQASVQRREENIKKEKLAQSAGFENLDILLRARRFAALPEEEQERILEASEQRNIPPFPERESKAADRRRERVNEQAEDANDRDTEKRTRSISVGLGEVKEEAKRYLSAQYTNDDGELFCQLCKRPMPFKLDDGTYYFEAVEFLGSLKKRHYQNYLALCPNHSAMFRHANGSEKLMYDMFLELESIELDVVLTQKDMSIKFTQIHIDDLKNVVATDKKSKE